MLLLLLLLLLLLPPLLLLLCICRARTSLWRCLCPQPWHPLVSPPRCCEVLPVQPMCHASHITVESQSMAQSMRGVG
jgi:hypothetical protein